jgi:hypothetical protein
MICFKHVSSLHISLPSLLHRVGESRNNLRNTKQFTRFALLILGMLIFTGCAAPIPVPVQQDAAPELVAESNARLEDIAGYDLAAEPVIIPDITAVVITEGTRANVRGGPESSAPIVAKANPGEQFKVVGASDDREWWQICCVSGGASTGGEPSETAWVAASVIRIDGNLDAIPVVEALLPEDVAATWIVDWKCGSARCDIKQCKATVDAKVSSQTQQQWLEVAHDVIWDEGCFEDDSWSFEVDRFTGRERSGEFIDNFLFSYWAGRQPGPATNVFRFENGRKVAVWCSGPHELELPEEGGWLTVYQGNTCHDVRTGELVSLSYVKRWLYSGEYEGQRYERAYFGDYESLDQYLVDTNASLSYIE